MSDPLAIDLLHHARFRQVPAQLPVTCRITPEPGFVLVVDGFRRLRGLLEFRTLAVASDDRWVEFALGRRRGTTDVQIEVRAEVDGRTYRSGDLSLFTDGTGGGSGRAVAEWLLPVPDDARSVRIGFACDELPLRRVVELDPDVLAAALEEVWDLGQPG